MQEVIYIGKFLFSGKLSCCANNNVADTRRAQLESVWRTYKREDSYIHYILLPGNTMYLF